MTGPGNRTRARRNPAGTRLVRRARQFQLLPAGSEAATTTSTAAGNTGVNPGPGIPRVLLIEDDASVRDAIMASLEELGARDVAVADDGEAGLAMIRSLHPAVVLLDLMLPVADGFDVLAELRKLPPAERPGRVVVVSAMSDALSATALLQLGADRVLAKPFTLTEFEAAITG